MWYEKTYINGSMKWIKIFNDENQGLKVEDWELDRAWEAVIKEDPDYITIELMYDQEFAFSSAFFFRANIKNPKLQTFFCPKCFKYLDTHEEMFFFNNPILRTNKIIKSKFENVNFKNKASAEIQAYILNENTFKNCGLWGMHGCTLLSYFIEEEHYDVIFQSNNEGFVYLWKYKGIPQRFKLELNEKESRFDVIDKNEIVYSESLERFFTAKGFYNRYYEIVSYLNNFKKLNLEDKNDI